jgi:DNA-binding response OmpR family regulator
MSTTPSALLVGHCGYDSGKIRTALEAAGCDSIDSADSVEEALERCRTGEYNLVLGNRVIGFDQTGGEHLVEALKGDEATKETPVLILSAFEETQAKVASLGGEPGFGKDELSEPATIERLASYF